MTTPAFRKASLLAIAVSAALAACGGGGGGDSTPAATTTPPANTTTGTTTTGQTLVANVGTTNSPTNNTNTTNPVVGVTPPAPVPTANQVVSATLPLTSSYTGEGVPLFNSINDWRNQMRIVTVGSPLGVGVLPQTTSLDTLAASLRTSQPNLFSATATPAERTAAIAAAQSQMTALGYQTAYVLAGQSDSAPLQVSPGNFCAKSLFSTLPGVEMLTSGVRDVGLTVTDVASGCLVLAGITNNNQWQLPPADSTSVYPFPGKQLTLPQYYGDFSALGFTTRPGHAILASVASSDALPVAVTGAGTGQPIPTSQITVQEFSMRVVSSPTATAGSTVTVQVFSQAGVVGSGVALTPTTQLLFPTSIMAVPVQPLQGATVYSVTFRATVRGRPVTRTWEFTTA